MLQFLGMTINNFGPYKGENNIDFTDKSGVSIFWGDNGRGKTTLLNAFRFALFGAIQRRHGRLLVLREMENYESRSEGIYGFSVSIRMQNDQDQYLLTRSFALRPGVDTPKSDADYERQVFLKKNGSILSARERDHVLNVLMPEQVSRFFLFDGELLQEYEGLVVDEANSGERIKESIEKILGVPVLQNGEIDLEDIASDLARETLRIGQKNDKTKRLASQIASLEVTIAEHSHEIECLRVQVEEQTAERVRVSDLVSKTAQIREWIAIRETKRAEVAKFDQQEEDVLRQIVETTTGCWKGMLSEKIEESISSLNVFIQGLEKKKQNSYVADRFITEMRTACDNKRCPVCTQSVDGDILQLLLERIRSSESKFSGLTEEENEELLLLMGQVSILKKLLVPNKKEILANLERRLNEIKIGRADCIAVIEKYNKFILNYEEENGEAKEVGLYTQQLAQIEAKLMNLNTAISEEKKKRDAAVAMKAKLQEQMNKAAAPGEMTTAATRERIANDLYAIFNEGKELYSLRLKENVERDATEIFVRIANDKAYSALRINDSYGLHIVHEDGTIIPGRSAGYEHVVALSLIAALHKNAPLQGPIIMDSPFGRLDPTHKRNIVSVLPSMANQVFLLVYTDEIDEQFTRETIGSSLVTEKRLARISSMHTRIE